MTTDNRTNELNQNETKSAQTFCFSEAQVEAAAKAMHETGNPWFAAYGDWGAAGFEIKKAFRESARAALVAAQGAAPQDEPSEEWLTWCREESCVHRHWRSGGMPTHRRGDDCPTLGNHAPVLPSSTVDEDAREFRFTDAQWREYQSIPMQGYSHRGHLEHVFNEWLKGQGR